MKITHSEKQSFFLDELMKGRNIFLTGKAGTGKSFIVKEAIKILKKQGQRIIALAPTGIASYNIGGQTLHSMFGLPINGVMEYKECSFLKSAKRKILKKVDVIFIDEVSMLRPDMLDALHWTLVKNGLGKLTNKQLIFVGDLKQLPAPIDDNTMSVLLTKYDGFKFHDCQMYNDLQVEKIELDFIHRQSDPDFIEALNVVRDGGKSDYFKQFVSEDASGIVLAPHNATVAKYNIEGLAAIKSKNYNFKAKLTGNAKAYDFTLEENLNLKDGCKIMYLVNSKENPLYNGSLGVFRMKKGLPYIEIEKTQWLIEHSIMDKKAYVYNDFTKEIEMQEIGSMTQLPVKLAYALTIHKFQGLTFDEITVDLSRKCFAKGQLYTALSRVKTPKGLKIKIK